MVFNKETKKYVRSDEHAALAVFVDL